MIPHFESCVVLERVLDASSEPTSSPVGLIPRMRESICAGCGEECREVCGEEDSVVEAVEGWEDRGDGESKVTP